MQAILLFKGRVIDNDGNVSFKDLYVPTNTTFLLVCAPSDLTSPLEWHRFKLDLCDVTQELREGRSESIVIVPKRQILFYGFGVYSESNFQDMNLEVTWEILD